MKPFRIFIFFLLVCGLLLALSAVFPGEGIRLGKELKLRFISASELFVSDTLFSGYTDSLIRYADIADDPEWEIADTRYGVDSSVILFHAGGQAVPDTLMIASAVADSGAGLNRTLLNGTLLNGVTDSGALLSGAAAHGSAVAAEVSDRWNTLVNTDSLVMARVDSIYARVHPLEISGRATADLVRFFRSAGQASGRGELVRILHYGDSQIENDRMTALLRYRFQKVFGGSGCGMVPAVPLYSGNPVFREHYTGNWTRHTGFGRRDTTLGHSSYGVMACFTAVPPTGKGSLPSLEFAFLQGKRASQFSTMKLFLHSYANSGMVAVHYNDSFTDTVRNIRHGYQELTFSPGFTPGKVKLEFDLTRGGRIYGISFDPDAGLQVDNIAMRGSSGLEFSRFDRQLQDTMLTAVNPGMIIMQFGGNVVPYIKNAAHYKRFFKRELRYMKRLCPEAVIIVIGPADMSKKENGRFITWESLEPVRDAMREAALESDCAFWDMYKAMGGKNSMKNFVLADPPLATSDYIHFTPRGANLMAGMFFDAVMLEYERCRMKGQLP